MDRVGEAELLPVAVVLPHSFFIFKTWYTFNMKPDSLKELSQHHICELCLRHDPLVKDYSEDFELQTSLRDYIEKQTGERINLADVAKLCDSCYVLVNEMADQKDM
jgi:hypothetical protein